MSSHSRTIALSAAASGIVSLAVVSAAPSLGLTLPSIGAPAASQSPIVPAIPSSEQEQGIIEAVRQSEPAVVSVIVSKNLPVLERIYETPETGNPLFDQFFQIPRVEQRGTELQEIGGGTAFFISADGLLLTNRHVVADENARYSVLLNDGRTLEARVIGRDPTNDIALLKVEGSGFPFLKLSEQAEPVLGQTVIAIGNALAEFRNTVSVGIISGLQRDIVAGNPYRGDVERLSRIIQTDAAINEGNSGGPLLSSQGEVIGMSTAVAQGAQNIGFAIPVQDLRRTVQSYEKHGRIVRPFLGVRYAVITPALVQEKNLDVDEGALVVRGDTPADAAIAPDSPAAKAGLREGDILTHIDGQKLTEKQTVTDIIQGKLPGDTVTIDYVRDDTERETEVTLEEWRE